MNRGQALWEHAKGVIPGGGMLLSKRSEMLLPGHWPAYFKRASGCTVWDLDDRELTDVSLMGVGTNTLGYARTEIDEAVVSAIRDGNMSTLNCEEDVYLAEKLVEMHPWADMARFARSGGEANSIAVRIARAASGRDEVALCGYHGWHDWYLAANLSADSSLDGHLLPGLQTQGVPRALQDNVHTFGFGELERFNQIINQRDIGVVIMEVARSGPPEVEFLREVREVTTRNNIVLVFDECTSGFRETFGGLHLKYGVFPDLAVFGKALGNGFAITAVIGRRDVMEAAQDSFISSTFWTERIGPVAALKTLEVMSASRSWEFISATGDLIRIGWQDLANKYGLRLHLWGLRAIPGFTVRSRNALAYKTLVTQMMLERGFLASNSVYVSTAHKPEIINKYLHYLDPVFQTIAECEDGRPISDVLRGPVCHDSFRRLN